MLGYPGAGKTTVAKVINELTGAVHIWADKTRRDQFGKPSYTEQENKLLYAQLNKQTNKLLNSGQDVIFDTSFNYFVDRETLRKLAKDAGAKCSLIWVKVDEEIAKHRATKLAHLQPTRTVGDMKHDDFNRLKLNLEPPRESEKFIELDGTKITQQYIAEKLEIS